jgi:hypothetical protein
MVFGWFASEHRDRRRTIRLDRKHLEARARRFLTSYLEADELTKPRFYGAVEEASKQCQPALSSVPSSELGDARIAEFTSDAAMQMVLARQAPGMPNEDGLNPNFVTDAFATVAIAYRRAAGVYTTDQEMQELGTAAVHLLTMATSYINREKE